MGAAIKPCLRRSSVSFLKWQTREAGIIMMSRSCGRFAFFLVRSMATAIAA
jgi:hypothetical protein